MLVPFQSLALVYPVVPGDRVPMVGFDAADTVIRRQTEVDPVVILDADSSLPDQEKAISMSGHAADASRCAEDAHIRRKAHVHQVRRTRPKRANLQPQKIAKNAKERLIIQAATDFYYFSFSSHYYSLSLRGDALKGVDEAISFVSRVNRDCFVAAEAAPRKDLRGTSMSGSPNPTEMKQP